MDVGESGAMGKPATRGCEKLAPVGYASSHNRETVSIYLRRVVGRGVKLFRSILLLSSRQLAVRLFGPVALSLLLYAIGYTLAAFIVVQLFIEGFALWQLAIGLTLFRSELGVSRGWFIFNMVFAMLYRLTTNGYQIYHHVQYGAFFPMETVWWIVPVHLYASLGVVYCFYVNARLIRNSEEKIGMQDFSVKQIFFRLLLFPWGMWYVQPRLNRMAT